MPEDVKTRISRALPEGWFCHQADTDEYVIEREKTGATATISDKKRWWSFGQTPVLSARMLEHGFARKGYQGANYIERMVRDSVAKIREVEG